MSTSDENAGGLILPLAGRITVNAGKLVRANGVIEFEDGKQAFDVTFGDVEVVEPAPAPAPSADWTFPMGTVEYPPEAWYAASRHLDYDPSIWKGGYHTGIDYNLDRKPWGDVETGLPVFAVASGVIHGTWHSEANQGSVVIEIEHDGKSLWIRYWHLARDDAFLAWRAGDRVLAGGLIGHIGDYPRGGAHLHFDMCTGPFHPGVWWTTTTDGDKPGPEWVDPVGVLKAHLDEGLVEMSLQRGDG